MAKATGRRVVGEILCNSFARLADLYVVEIDTEPTGNEWIRVGEELSAAMEQVANELIKPAVTIDDDELVEA